jgi:CO/xanthine dehydrogenase FAD-binding subunit
MKPAPFEYSRPESVQEVCALLAEEMEARVIAGGQTLVPMLAMRLSRPTRLVDIARIPELSGIRQEDGVIVIGAATRQVEAERSGLVAERVPLLAAALPWVGHPPTRARGTIGGSIAHADPSAEIALVAVTLGAEIVVQDPDETSAVPAGEFVIGAMLTAIPMGGCITAIRFPVWSEGRIGVGFHEISARRSDYAFVSAAAQVALDVDGTCTRCAVGIGSVGDMPVALAESEHLVGSRLADAEIRDAVRAGAEAIEAHNDLHASASYRRRTAAVLAARALASARDQALGTRP